MEDTIGIIVKDPLNVGRVIVIFLPFSLMFAAMLYTAHSFNTKHKIYIFGHAFDYVVRAVSVIYIGITIFMIAGMTIFMLLGLPWSLEQKISSVLALCGMALIQPWHVWKSTKKMTIFMCTFLFVILAGAFISNLQSFSLTSLEQSKYYSTTITAVIFFIVTALIVFRTHKWIAPILQKIHSWFVIEVSNAQLVHDDNVLKTQLFQPLAYVLTILKCIMAFVIMIIISHLLPPNPDTDTSFSISATVFLIATFSARTYLIKYQQKLNAILNPHPKKRYEDV